jgi:hypothetical protein
MTRPVNETADENEAGAVVVLILTLRMTGSWGTRESDQRRSSLWTLGRTIMAAATGNGHEAVPSFLRLALLKRQERPVYARAACIHRACRWIGNCMLD